MSERKSKNKTLSEKIAESFTPSSIADPEYDPDEATARIVSDIDEFDYDDKAHTSRGLSEIRKRNVKLLSDCSDKYKGKISSRKEYEEEVLSNESESENDVDNLKNSSLGDDDDASEEELNPSEKYYDSEDEDDEDDGLEEYREKLKNCQLDSEPDESLGTDDETIIKSIHKASSSKEQRDEDSDYDSPGEYELEEEEEDDGSEDEEEESENDSEKCSEVSDDEEAGPSTSKNLLKESDKTVEIQKGLSVQNQLKIWEKLLEIRIHSQKMLTKANSLPNPSEFESIENKNEEFSNLAKETVTGVSNLLNNMLEMQKTLYEQYSETKDNLKKKLDRKRKSNSQDTETETETPFKKIALELEEDFENFRPYQNSVLQKWYDRTKILTPGGAKNKGGTEDFDILRKIETVLFNKTDLVKKSQTVKGNYKLFHEIRSSSNNDMMNEDSIDHNKETDENMEECTASSSSPEIYDDMDFYHQQLRELIEFKTNMTDNPEEMTKQFTELQKLRKKMKKTVDTRASKGRKVRYVVHNKLVNFMAPQDNSEWTEESKNELFRSLFAT